jgi:hypothetical protein
MPLATWQVAPGATHGLVVNPDLVGDGAVGLFGIRLEAAGQDLAFFLLRQMPAVQIQVQGHLAFLVVSQPGNSLNGNDRRSQS